MTLYGELGARRCDVRWLLGTPLLLCALAAGVIGTIVVARAVAAVRTAAALRSQLEQVAVGLAAEHAAALFVASEGSESRRTFDAGRGIVVRTRVTELADGAGALVDATLDGASQGQKFAFDVLPGGVPDVFGLPLAALDGGPALPAGWQPAARVSPGAWPVLRLDGARPVGEGNLALGLQRDPGIALLRLQIGTDRPDYLFGGGTQGLLRVEPPTSGVVAIDGNLWVDCGDRPLCLELRRSLTLVVRGNVYLGRSVRVRGPGLLTIVSRCADGRAFTDRDGDGRWSAGDELCDTDTFRGPVEGGGNVWLGLPVAGGEQLEIDAGLIVDGQLHVGVQRAAVHGAVVLRHGAVAGPGVDGVLVATGRLMPDLQRGGLPGFEPIGAPRPGRLLRVVDQALYRARPSR